MIFRCRNKESDPVEERFNAMVALIKDLPRADYKIYKKNYLVSDAGKVYSIDYASSRKCKEVAYFINNKGYRWVSIYDRETKKSKSTYVHRIVAECFIDNPLNKKEVNHIDGDRLNNDASNLEWVTRSENELHKLHTLGHYKTGTKIRCIETGDTYKSIHEAERDKQVLAQNIWKVLRGQRKTCGGYHWEEI